MQHMLVGEADGAMHLMRDGRAFRGGFAGADFRRRRFEQHRVVECGALARSCRRRNRRRRARPRFRRRAARGSAARPGICRSCARRRRAHWRKRRSATGSPPARRRFARCARSRPSASARMASKPAGAARCGSALVRSKVTVLDRIAGEILAFARRGSRRSSPTRSPRPLSPLATTAMCSRSLAKGIPLALPLNVPSAFSVIRSRGRTGATVIAPAGAFDAGLRQQPAGEQRFGQRHRQRVAAGGAENGKAVGQARAGAAQRFPAPRRASARHRTARATACPSSRRRGRC